MKAAVQCTMYIVRTPHKSQHFKHKFQSAKVCMMLHNAYCIPRFAFVSITRAVIILNMDKLTHSEYYILTSLTCFLTGR